MGGTLGPPNGPVCSKPTIILREVGGSLKLKPGPLSPLSARENLK